MDLAALRAHGIEPERMRALALDGALLLFDRESGLTVIADGPETAHLRQRAPRMVQMAITNACNLSCAFCYRDEAPRSAWTVESAMELLSGLDAEGVLEVAFGGGEPLVFRRFATLLSRVHAETRLAASFTTNGVLLDRALLRAIEGRFGMIRLSMYGETPFWDRVTLLAAEGARFGVNVIVWPERLPHLSALAFELLERGCTDILFLRYHGHEPGLHLTAAQLRAMSDEVRALSRALGTEARISVDVCWGDALHGVSRLPLGGPREGCGAGRDFVSIGSDRTMSACSFQSARLPFESACEAVRLFRRERALLAGAAPEPGCARREGRPSLPVVA